MKPFNLVLTILTIMNITEITVNGKIAKPLREKVGIDHDVDGNRIGNNGSYISELLSCFWCTSVWSSAFVSLMYLILPNNVYKWLVMTFAYSWLATYFNEKVQ